MAYHTTWGTTTELVPDMADGHKSFHGKAYVRQGDVLTADCEYKYRARTLLLRHQGGRYLP